MCSASRVDAAEPYSDPQSPGLASRNYQVPWSSLRSVHSDRYRPCSLLSGDLPVRVPHRGRTRHPTSAVSPGSPWSQSFSLRSGLAVSAEGTSLFKPSATEPAGSNIRSRVMREDQPRALHSPRPTAFRIRAIHVDPLADDEVLRGQNLVEHAWGDEHRDRAIGEP